MNYPCCWGMGDDSTVDTSAGFSLSNVPTWVWVLLGGAVGLWIIGEVFFPADMSGLRRF